MGFLDNLMGRNQSVSAHVIAPSVVGAGVDGEMDGEKAGMPIGAAAASPDGFASRDVSTLSLEERNEREVDNHGNEVTATAELGVQKAEAVALVWSKKAVYLTYLWIWVCFFMLALQQSILSNVMYYAYSDFASAPQISTAYILAYVVGGVLKLPIAKVLNIWGRAEGFFVFEAVYLLGIVIIAACNGPNSYAAGYVIYWIGYDALYFIMDVFIADTSGLRNRAFAFAFVSTPFICTAFTGPLAAQSFLNMTSWRWAAGAFAIIMFFVFSPLGIIFKFFQRKAEKQGLFTRPDTGRSVWQSIEFYFHDFDIIGACLLIIAWVLFLLPFSMVSNGVAGYHEAKFIAMVVIGIVFFFVFAAWERFLARTHFIRWELFRSRTVVGASIMSAVIYYSFYSWDLYYYYFIRVVYDLSISKTGYMTQIYNVGSCFFGPLFGLWVRYTKHFKYACLFFGLPLMMLGAGLMIRFRGQDSNIGFIVMCQIFIAFAGGTLTIGTSMAYMTAADRNGVPLMLAMQYLFTSLGGAIGTAVCGSIYQSTFREALRQRLPAESQGDIETIINGGYLVQLEYPVGNATREAINYAWGYSQKYNSISSTAILALGIVGIMLWKNYNVDKKQNKGTLI